MKTYSLKELRARKNETQEETARAVNTSTTTYNSWEANPGMIKLSNLILLAKHFGVSLDEIKG